MATPDPGPLLSAARVVRRYPARGRTWGRGGEAVTALDGASLDLRGDEVVGLVGRSGSGKSTLARVMLGLERPDRGEVAYAGRPVATLRSDERRRMRREVQIVFQDPHGALDPLQRVASIVAEPLRVHGLAAPRAAAARAADLLSEVGLAGGELLRRRPHELSGGERQRVAIARALASGPRALVLDEPVSALDVSVRGQVLNLLLRLRRRGGLAILLITHDVRLVAALCSRVAVMARGTIVEEGPPAAVLGRPGDPATAELVAAASEMSLGSPG